MARPYSATRLLAEIPRLRRYARILADDAERADHLVEETLARARQMPDEPIARAAPDTRLIALLRAVNAAATVALPKREATATTASADRGPRVDERPGRQSERSRSARGAEMLARLRELPLAEREMLVLVAVERLSYAEVADLLGMPVATVISRLSQARETLRARTSKPRSTPSTC